MVKNSIWVQTFKISLPPCPPAPANGFLKQQTTAKTKGCSRHGHTAPIESQGKATVREGWDALSKGQEGGVPLRGRPHSSHWTTSCCCVSTQGRGRATEMPEQVTARKGSQNGMSTFWRSYLQGKWRNFPSTAKINSRSWGVHIQTSPGSPCPYWFHLPFFFHPALSSTAHLLHLHGDDSGAWASVVSLLSPTPSQTLWRVKAKVFPPLTRDGLMFHALLDSGVLSPMPL